MKVQPKASPKVQSRVPIVYFFPCIVIIMEWFDSLCAWVMSVIASLLALFGVSSVETLCVPTPLSHGEDVKPHASESIASIASKTSEVLDAFAAQAAQVAPILVELAEESVAASEEPSNM
jgi:hypothetical protein